MLSRHCGGLKSLPVRPADLRRPLARKDGWALYALGGFLLAFGAVQAAASATGVGQDPDVPRDVRFRTLRLQRFGRKGFLKDRATRTSSIKTLGSWVVTSCFNIASGRLNLVLTYSLHFLAFARGRTTHVPSMPHLIHTRL